MGRNFEPLAQQEAEAVPIKVGVDWLVRCGVARRILLFIIGFCPNDLEVHQS